MPNQDDGKPPQARRSGLALVSGSSAGQAIQKYDEAEFLVGGRLKGKGGGELQPEHFKWHEGYAREATKWMEWGGFPYETRSDLLRHAAVRHVRYFLPSMEGEVDGSLLREMAHIDDRVARWKFHNDFTEQFDAIAEEVNRTLQMPGGRAEVERMLRAVRKRIESARQSYWKGVWLKMFDDRFGVYISKIVLLNYGPDEATVFDFPEVPDLSGWDRGDGEED